MCVYEKRGTIVSHCSKPGNAHPTACVCQYQFWQVFRTSTYSQQFLQHKTCSHTVNDAQGKTGQCTNQCCAGTWFGGLELEVLVSENRTGTKFDFWNWNQNRGSQFFRNWDRNQNWKQGSQAFSNQNWNWNGNGNQTYNPEPRTSTRPATRFFFQEPDLELDSRPHFFGNKNQNQNCSKFF